MYLVERRSPSLVTFTRARFRSIGGGRLSGFTRSHPGLLPHVDCMTLPSHDPSVSMLGITIYHQNDGSSETSLPLSAISPFPLAEDIVLV